MKKKRKGKHFIKNPFYEGGLKAMREFISKNKKYPKEALKEKIEGTVVVKYTINYKGKVIGTKVMKSLGFGCDEEAQRVIKLLKFEAPKNRGIKVKFFKNIQIHFRLPKEKEKTAPPVQSQTSYSYTITPTKKEENPPKPKERRRIFDSDRILRICFKKKEEANQMTSSFYNARKGNDLNSIVYFNPSY